LALTLLLALMLSLLLLGFAHLHLKKMQEF
jgi:hypothetical protein